MTYLNEERNTRLRILSSSSHGEEIQTNEATVVSIGQGVDLPLAVGATVFVRNRAGHELRDEQHRLVSAYDFWNIVAKSENGTIVPLGNRVMLKVEKAKETSGILLNPIGTAKPNSGCVVAKSSDAECPAAIGDTVSFDFFNVDNVQEYLIVTSESIKLIKKDTTFEPLTDWVLVKIDDVTHKDQGGLLIAETVYSYAVRATIIAAGKGFTDKLTGKFYPTNLNAGERCIISPKAGVETVIDNVTYRIIQAKEVMGILK